jgi:tetratricopeptide (TPR) repeat protein
MARRDEKRTPAGEHTAPAAPAGAEAPGALACLRADRRFVLIVGLVALLLPLLHLWFIRNNPTFNVPIIDSREYVETARQMLNPNFVFRTPYYHSPVYPWFMAALCKLFGQDNFVAVRLAQVFLNLVTCFLIYALGCRLFSRPVARVAAVIWALYGPAIFYTAELFNVPLILLLDLAALYLVVCAWDRPTRLRWLAAGAMTGLAAITRPDILPFAALAAAAVILMPANSKAARGTYEREIPSPSHLPRGERGICAAVFLLAVAAPLLFVGLRNYEASGRFSMLPANSGLAFYQGNNPDYRNTIGIRPGAEWEKLTGMPLAEQAAAEQSDPGHSAFYYRKSVEFMRGDPAAYARSLGFKFQTLLNGYELPETLDIYTFRVFSPIMAALVWRAGPLAFPYGLLLPLALLGAVFSGLGQGRAWLWVLLLALCASLIGYWNSSRYRLPAVPILILFAACALVWARDAALQRRFRELGFACAGALVLGIALNWPLEHFSRQHNFMAELYGVAGTVRAQDSRLDEGISLLRQSLDLEPNNFDIRTNLGWALAQRGKHDEAAAEYLKALALSSNTERVHTNLAVSYLKLGREQQAVQHLNQALRINPHFAEAHYNLGNILANKNQNDEAVPHYREAIHARADYSDAHANLAVVLERLGRKSEAMTDYERSLELNPLNAEAHNKLAVLLAYDGQLDKAIEHFRQALAIRPDWVEVKKNLELAQELKWKKRAQR